MSNETFQNAEGKFIVNTGEEDFLFLCSKCRESKISHIRVVWLPAVEQSMNVICHDCYEELTPDRPKTYEEEMAQLKERLGFDWNAE